MQPRGSISVGGVLFAAILIIGGIFVVMMGAAQAGSFNVWFIGTSIFLGAGLGGALVTFAAKRGTTETILGTILAMIPFYIWVFFLPGDINMDVATRLIGFGLVLAIGAAAGAVLGTRLPWRPRRDGNLYWCILAGVIMGGMWALTISALVAATSMGYETAVGAGMGISIFTGGVVTQLVCPMRRPWLCGSGLIFAVIPAAAVGAFSAPKMIMAPSAGVMLWPLGAIGAALAWHMFKKRHQASEGAEMAAVFD